MSKTIRGVYSAYGYQILDENGEETYSAGNSQFESQGYIDPKAPSACTLRDMRAMCIQQAKAEASERDAEYLGVERDDDYLRGDED